MSASKSSPKDAQVMSAILKDMGVLDSETRLINQMLEFTYRYVTDVLEDAKVYSNHANRKNIDAEDIKLAVQVKMDHSFTSPPPRDLLMEIARQKNSQPLPLIKPYCGPRLPPDRYCLSQPNYKLKTVKKPRSMQYGLPMSQRLGINPQVKSLGTPNLAVVNKPMTQPTVAIINKQPALPKPTVRINPGLAGGIGSSGLTRIINANSVGSNITGSSQSAGMPAAVSEVSSFATITNPLKRKREDDDDYDKV